MSGRDPRDFDVDMGEMADLLKQMAGTNKVAADALADVGAVVSKLQTTWQGAGADAHKTWHDDWTASVEDLRDGLKTLNDSVGRTHRNYAWAIEANRQMWDI